MANILKKPKHRARLPRQGHDLSRRINFTSSCGHLLPVFHDFLIAGDRVKINDYLFTRTQPLKTCAFVRCYEYIDYFFVPMQQIDAYFGNAFYGIDDFMDSNMVDGISGTSGRPYHAPSYGLPKYTYSEWALNLLFPMIYTQDLYQYIKGPYMSLVVNDENGIASPSNSFLDDYGIPVCWNELRLAHHLRHGNQIANYNGTNFTCGSLNMSTRLHAVYQKIFYDYYRLTDWTANNPFAFSLNSAIKEGSYDASSIERGQRHVRSLFTLHYHPLKRDFFTNIQPSPLFDPDNVNAYPAADLSTSAYSSVNSYLQSAYGIVFQGFAEDNQFSVNERVNPLLNDYFHGGAYGYDMEADPAMTTQKMRLMFAYERMLAITQRAGKHYEDQVSAHLGVNVPKGIGGECYFLGSHRSQLRIGEVLGTAAGSDGEGTTSVLGEIAGRGLSSSDMKRNKIIRFTAPCDGYIMAIYSCIPEIDYRDAGIDKLNLYHSIMDWPRPEFDNLGMQPLFAIQSHALSSAINGTGDLNDLQGTSLSLITGWQYRYSELKLAYDVTMGAFNDTLRDWTSSIIFGQFGGIEASMYCPPTYLDGLFAVTFAPPRFYPDASVSEVMPSAGVYYELSVSENTKSTSSEDSVAAVQISSGSVNHAAWNNSIMYERDPLLHSLDISYQKVSFLSTYSLPKL